MRTKKQHCGARGAMLLVVSAMALLMKPAETQSAPKPRCHRTLASSLSQIPTFPNVPPVVPDKEYKVKDVLERTVPEWSKKVDWSFLEFCTSDIEREQDLTYQYSGDPGSLQKCQEQLGDLSSPLGDSVVGYLCRSEEIKSYFQSLYAERTDNNVPYCQLAKDSDPIPACRPGFMSRVLPDPEHYKNLDDNVADIIPCRSLVTKKCCPGFFCPENLACMIPCPLGSYCPTAGLSLDPDVGYKKGRCSPYEYIPQIMPSFDIQPDVTKSAVNVQLDNTTPFSYQCGGADTWTVAIESKAIFCPPKKYCLDTTSEPIICPRGHHCRLGSDRPRACGADFCPRGTEYQNMGPFATALVILVMLGVAFCHSCTRKRYEDGRKKKAAQAEAAAVVEMPPVHHSTEEKDEEVIEVENGRNLRRSKSLIHNTIDVEFVDLCLVLKRGGRVLLRNVTGSLVHGRVTAVMGPSGAGKTTFLTTLAGKVSNSVVVTGTVSVNDSEGDMRAYRRIIGFVPQDDIVHSDLTVYENLRFSARYRLPTRYSRAQVADNIERTIESLGLGHIRDDIVGSVEKRGISGGQRKRVNVGLEMVMNPALLILDEPTSGLDSTSSRQVIEALLKEAARGVNVGVVLHQPSYTIFQMFDDIMFLAKGGKVAYHGPVAEIEDYFSKLGYQVPGKVNPADYYMDVLEGKEASSHEGMSAELLPLRWAEVNGYTYSESDEDILKAARAASKHSVTEKGRLPSWARPVFGQILDFLEDTWESVWEVLWPPPDQSKRKTPNFFIQYYLILSRCFKQRYYRGFVNQMVQLTVMTTGGLIVGLLTTYDDTKMGVNIYMPLLLVALSLLHMISTLPTFNADALNYYRESASGINKLSYFLAKDTLDLINVLLKPLLFLATFYFITLPKSTFADNLGVSVLFCYCLNAYAYWFSIAFVPSSAQMVSVLFALTTVLLNTSTSNGTAMKIVKGLTPTRWALEIYYIVTVKRFSGVYLLTRCGILMRSGFHISGWERAVAALIAFALIFRIVAYVALVMTKRDKQR